MTNPSESGSNARAALIVVALTFLSAGVTAPFFFSKHQMTGGQHGTQMIHTHDMVAHVKMMEQFDLSLKSGLIEPRWFSEVNNGYGSATFNFYPRVFYYLTSLTNLAAHDWKATLFILSIIGLASSGLTFYWLSRVFYGRAASAIAALIYMLLPYHQIDLYWRGAIPEYIGFALLPLILGFAIKVAIDPAPRYYAGLGFFYGLHLMTHMPVGLMFSYAMVLFAITWSIKVRDPKITLRIGTGMALGVAFSATYWVPALLEAGYIFEPASGTFPYHRLYIQLGTAANAFDELIAMSFRLDVLLILAAALVLKSKSAVVRDSAASEQRLWVNLWLFLGATALFMCTALSYDISRLLPKIQAAVPPFRWLSIANLFAMLLLAASIDRLRSEMPGLLKALALAIVVALNLWVNFSGVIAGSMVNPPEFFPDHMVDSGFIPAGATLPNYLPDTPNVELQPAGGSTEILWWQPESRQIAVRVEQPSTVRLKTYNFRGWTATVDGGPVALSSDQDGVQTVNVAAGTHMIQLRFRNTWQRVVGQVLSIFGALGILTLALYRRTHATRDETAPVTSTPGRQRLQRLVENKRTLVVSGVVILGTLTALAVMRLSRPNSGASPPQAGATTDSGTPETAASESSALFIPGRETIPVAVDEKALDQLISALSSQDTAGVESLTQSGKVLQIENRTRVRVLERSSGKIRIRIIEGKYQWAEAWALEAWVR
jgi:hypothetical protein